MEAKIYWKKKKAEKISRFRSEHQTIGRWITRKRGVLKSSKVTNVSKKKKSRLHANSTGEPPEGRKQMTLIQNPLLVGGFSDTPEDATDSLRGDLLYAVQILDGGIYVEKRKREFSADWKKAVETRSGGPSVEGGRSFGKRKGLRSCTYDALQINTRRRKEKGWSPSNAKKKKEEEGIHTTSEGLWSGTSLEGKVSAGVVGETGKKRRLNPKSIKPMHQPHRTEEHFLTQVYKLRPGRGWIVENIKRGGSGSRHTKQNRRKFR